MKALASNNEDVTWVLNIYILLNKMQTFMLLNPYLNSEYYLRLRLYTNQNSRVI